MGKKNYYLTVLLKNLSVGTMTIYADCEDDIFQLIGEIWEIKLNDNNGNTIFEAGEIVEVLEIEKLN